MKNRKKVQARCPVCNGKGVVLSDDTVTISGQKHSCQIPCDACNGCGRETHWIMTEEPVPHRTGSFRFIRKENNQ